jgi:hypothetical protein
MCQDEPNLRIDIDHDLLGVRPGQSALDRKEWSDKFGQIVKRCPRQDTSQNCSPSGRLAIAADLLIDDGLP